jgi:23S rRNA pseudouridine1911/1915/1917 synthase
VSGEERNGIVHRLDKDTTGAILIAKTNFAHQELAKQLQDRSMGRYYIALINHPLKSNLIVDKPIARNPKNRLKMGVIKSGKSAKSAFYKVDTSIKDSRELVAVKLFTGRTHQIRVHLNSLGRYILGDELYGQRDNFKGSMMLHANLLYFIHPVTKERVEVVAPPPKEMRDFLEINFENGKEYTKLDKESFKSFFSDSNFK